MIGLELVAKLKKIEYKEISSYLGISPQSVSDWIKGKRKIPNKRALQLEEFLGINRELIGKELTDEEKLKLHYELTTYGSNIIENIEEEYMKYGIEGQLSLDVNECEHGQEIYTTSELESKVKNERRKIKINEADIMISQLKEMYDERSAIDVHPEFQRVFRWSAAQKSRFIESILLGIPIPPIFVAEDTDLNWDVIDGVQRLSTVFEFLGVLRDDEEKLVTPKPLVGTKILVELEGKVWDNTNGEYKFSFSDSKYLMNAFLNATLKIIKIDSESDPKIKYDTFDRLNTGGTRLSDQEIRNCLAIMLNRSFYTWLRNLSYNPDFRRCLPLTEKALKEQDDLEYVLRFIVYRNIDLSKLLSSEDIGDLLTDKMREFCIENKLDYNREKQIFDKTFNILAQALGEDSFKKYYGDGVFKGAINLSNFEIIAIGVANNLEYILKLDDPIQYLRQKIKDLYSDNIYLKLQKQKISSQRAVTRFSKLTEYGTKYFRQ